MRKQSTVSRSPEIEQTAQPEVAPKRPISRKTVLHCDTCTAPYTAKHRGSRFCSQACYRVHGRENVQRTASAARGAQIARRTASGTQERTTAGRFIAGSSARSSGRAAEAVEPEPVEGATPDITFTPASGTTPAHYAFHYDPSEQAESASEWTGALRSGSLVTMSGYGMSLNVSQDRLIVHTESEPRRELLRGIHGIASIVMLGDSGTVSLAAMQWCRDQDITLLTVDRYGALCGVVEPSGGGAKHCQYSTLRRRQWTIAPMPLARELVAWKLRACMLARPETELAMRSGMRDLDGVQRLDTLHMLEARAAGLYWSCWSFDLRWTGRGVPDAWRRYDKRASILSSDCNARRATHPVNAMLNYGYAVLAGRIQRAIVSRGLDPMAGVLHADRDGRASLVYDLIEPLRAQVDSRLLTWVQGQTFKRSDVVVDTAGVVKLRPELGRVVVQESSIPQRAIDGVVSWYVDKLRDAT
ncbi:MAG: CRISPR-associated endonuclease Cas1 [Chloroflexota bacterium]|nr:MAG: CRISPR-associated endonuclease Cas1 [Chloroflexota bacterium]